MAPTTSSFVLAVSLQPFDPDFDEETRKSRQQRVKDAQEIAARYLGNSEKATLEDLAENPRYKEDLARIEAQLSNAVKQLQVEHEKIVRYLKTFAAKFA